jgi:hypothetical protein
LAKDPDFPARHYPASCAGKATVEVLRQLAHQQWLDDHVLRRLEVKSEYDSVAAGSVDGRLGDDELLDMSASTNSRQYESLAVGISRRTPDHLPPST